MDTQDIEVLRRVNPAWRLLRADNAAFVLGFLGRVFVEQNARSMPATDLVGLLDDELFALHERLGPGTYPRSAKAYLEDWASPDVGWLRKFYPAGCDEAHFDATPAVEKALGWVDSLQSRSFVGTESRLNTVFELLRQMVFGAETDPEVRTVELERRRAEIDAEIARLAAGQVEVMDASAQRDRYQQFSSTARELLADFREVETNFRSLDRQLRERIATWAGSKGALLDDVLGNRAGIEDSDQGRSFHAFYDFLLSSVRQEEFARLLAQVQSLAAIGEADPRLRHIHHDWLAAGERTQATVRQLSEQLRRFLDDQVWLENRRVMEILRRIEGQALALRDQGDVPVVTELDESSPTVVLPMERPLYAPTAPMALASAGVEVGHDDFDAAVLYEQAYVDAGRLSRGVRRALQRQAQIGLADLVGAAPLEHGLAELVTYLSLRDPGFDLVFDETTRDEIPWDDADGRVRVATVPRVTFTRTQTRTRTRTRTQSRTHGGSTRS